MESGPFKIVYNSDLIIRDRAEAASLCLFYDKVLLPFTSEATCSELAGTHGREYGYGHVQIKNWELEYGTLFDAGVLERLPHERPGWSELQPDDIILSQHPEHGARLSSDFLPRPPEGDFDILWVEPTTLLPWLKSMPKVRVKRPREKIAIASKEIASILSMPVRTFESGSRHYVAADLARHLLRTDIDVPQIFTTLSGQPVGRDVLVALEAEATFSYLLPKIRTYHPTQILELREKIADTREGFTMHLWQLSKGLEERAEENTPISEIAKYAKNLIETDLVPDYREFRRQLGAMKAGKWEKFLDAAGKVVEIDAAPWTPKFWGLLLKAIGLSLVTAAGEQQEMLSNKYQAFKFMSEVEGSK